jgi:hypothetical protein
MCRATKNGRALCFVATVMAFTSTYVSAQVNSAAEVNSWINPASGNWDQAANWALGVLPESSQSVMITNSGWKAVAINPSTPVNFPDSMTVSNLTIRGAWDTENVLLLNYFGTDLPLTVLNGLTLQDNAQIANFNSSLVVQGGTITVTNAQIFQDGGFIRTTNAPLYLQNAEYDLTNGIFEAGQVALGWPVSARFNQYGGAAVITNLSFGEGSPAAGGHFALYGGYLNLPNGLTLVGGDNAFSSYFQSGGSNQTTTVYIEPNMYGGTPSFTLNGGLLADHDVWINADDYGSPTLNQNGGTHIVTNTLYITGASSHGQTPHPGTYSLIGGILSAGVIELDAHNGDAVFVQSNGTATAGTFYAHSPGYFASFNTTVTLAGGTLGCSYYTAADGRGSLNQSGGALVVSNLLYFGGVRDLGMGYIFYGRYTFTGGTLFASNIDMRGDWFISDSSTNRISNPGFFSLSHALHIGNAEEQLGRFILETNATIDLAGEAAKLSFADSSAEVWNSTAKLIVTNWNWLTSEHYLGDQLHFGTNQSGLTAAQLQRIHFINPAGFSPGDYAAQILSDGEVVPGAPASADFINDWTGADGFWHDLTWSLGVRPDSSQTVRILGGNRTVTVNATTAASYPESLTVHDLVLRGVPGTPSLVLSNAGTTTPLRMLNGLLVQDGAKLVNLNSGVMVDGAVLTVTNAQIIQDGGFVRTTNATMYLQNAEYDLTNGVFEGGTVLLGLPVSARFNQYGGSVVIADLAFGEGPYYGAGGNYALYGGDLSLPNGLLLYSPGNASSSYFQAGGTNRTPKVEVEDGFLTLTLNGGLLADNDAVVMAGYYGTATIEQNGGTHVITNALSITGSAHNSYSVNPATYHLNGGTLSAGLIELGADQGDSVFVQSNGTAIAGTVYAHSLGYFASHNTLITLGGGSLICSNFTTVDGRGLLNQSGGALVVNNLLDFGGFRDLGSGYKYYGRYTFNGGTLTASNINISGDWVIGDSNTNRISNPGTFSLSHTLQISNAVEQLGRFILASNSTIDLAGSASRLTFANSSGETWAAGTTLVISDWNGDPSGGGAEQLRFGTDQSGLTPAQLSQIRFGSGTNLSPAKILSTGEVVPDQVVAASVTFSEQGNNLVLTWPQGWSLQSATNAPGPYVDVPEASSPYTINTTLAPQQFFRLRQ